MQYSRKIDREISENGIEFELGRVYARLEKLTDIRKAKGKRYSLITVLMIILMAKICGEDKPMGIADWATNIGAAENVIGQLAKSSLGLQVCPAKGKRFSIA